MSFDFEMTCNLSKHQCLDYDIKMLVKVNILEPGRPAFLSGPPENCYPAEPPELEIEEVEVLESPWEDDYVDFSPPSHVQEAIMDKALEVYYERGGI